MVFCNNFNNGLLKLVIVSVAYDSLLLLLLLFFVFYLRIVLFSLKNCSGSDQMKQIFMLDRANFDSCNAKVLMII